MAIIMAIRLMAMPIPNMGTATRPMAMALHIRTTVTPTRNPVTAMATRHIRHRQSTGLTAIRTGPITDGATTAAIEAIAGELIRALRYPRGRGKAP